jgi:hypothetical protein
MQEARAIFVSTVLSTRGAEASDDVVGFVANSRRFNVAVTRAQVVAAPIRFVLLSTETLGRVSRLQALLVIVGNATVAATVPHWHAYMDACGQFGTFDGPPPAAVGTLHSLADPQVGVANDARRGQSDA